MPEPEKDFKEISEDRLKEILQEEDEETVIQLKAVLDRLPKGTAVDGPAHYNGYQVLEAICDAGMARGFCLGNAVKYLLRAHRKNGGARDKQDLEKAQFYLNWFLERYPKYEGEGDDGKTQS